MLPRISIPDWKPPADGEAGCEVDATPRDGLSPAWPPASLPTSPSGRKTKSRAARSYIRSNSLKDAKVLAVSDMHRTESVLDPSLFQYHQHFESPWHLVGKTHLSEVFRVRHRVSGQVYAVKRSRRRFRSKLQRERCLREIRSVAELPPHPNIVNQYRAWQEGGHFYIQMDYCEGGSLAQRAHQACSQGQCMSDEQLWSTACQAAQGLSFLHSHSVLHLDVKPENIYLSAGTWRIGDFGLAVARDKDGSKDWEEGDGDYVAPELLQTGRVLSSAADIFSLGATLYECATGRKLPRSNGWTVTDVEQLEMPDRPPAFVQLLHAMLQPNRLLRPSAQQILELIALEQPAIAAAASQGVVPAAAEQQQMAEAAGCAASSATRPQQQQGLAVAAALAPSPFWQPVEPPAGDGSAAAASPGPPEQLPVVRSPVAHFSFDVPQRPPPSTGFTASHPLHAHNRRGSGSGSGGAPPGSGIKGTPAGRGRLAGRWAPALSPLISEGALTPGAAAGLVGLTPNAHGGSEGAPTPTLFGLAGSGSGGRLNAATPLDVRRPAPLQLPPQTAAAPRPTGSGGSGMLSAGEQQPGSSGTQDSGHGWRLSRRDIISPDSDLLNGSHSESDYSYSCGTGKTLSDMDFADALSPTSQELGGLLPFAAAGLTPSTSGGGTPSSLLLQRLEAEEDGPVPGDTPGTEPQLLQRQDSDLGVGSAGAPGIAGHLMQMAPSLAWDLHTSPEFLMQLPPGSPASLSRSSSMDDSASLPSRGVSVRRFPTLDSWGSNLDRACSKPLSRMDSLAALAAQRFTNSFVTQEQQPQQPATAAAPVPASGCQAGLAATGSDDGGGSGIEGDSLPPLVGRGMRKRQHNSSRRTLMAALSRDNSVASSSEGLQPVGKSRHIMRSGGASPASDMQQLAAPLLQQFASRPLLCSGSSLGREALAASELSPVAPTAAALEAAAAGLSPVASTPDAQMPKGAGAARWLGSSCDDVAAAAADMAADLVAPPLALHARMTCMKLRDTD